MPTLTINSAPFNSLPQGFGSGVLTTGNYYDTGTYAPAPRVYDPIYDDREVTYVALDGTGIIRFGKRFRMIEATVIFAGALNTAASQRDTFLASAKQLARYTVTMPDGTAWQGCKLAANNAQNWERMDGLCLCICSLVFRQLSDTN